MSEQMFVILMILSIGIILVAVSINSKRKQKNRIRNHWGTIPRTTHRDKEESLFQSYEKLKPRLDFDSEVDDITWYDLDLFSVFQEINHTHSSIGSEALYRTLRLFNFNQKKQEELEEIIDYYQEHPKKREKIEYIFSQLGKRDYNSVVRYLTDSNNKALSSLIVYVILGSLPIVSLFLLIIGIEQLGFLLLVGSLLFNVVYSFMKKTKIRMELNSMSYFVQTLNTTKKLIKVDHPLQKELKTLLKPFKSVSRFSFVFQENEHNGIGILLDYLNMLFMLPFIAYYFSFNQVRNHEKEGIQLWQTLGRLEVAYAVLNYRLILSLHTEPTFTEDEEVIGEAVYHPLIESPVANPVRWSRNTLVSGSNASGKSTYVKSVAINCILAQTINTCLAESFVMQRGHVLTSMAVEDDVLQGDSYFVAEIKSLKRVLDKVKTKERCYLFIDEILRGTNTVERIAASSSMIHWMADYPSLAFVATHDIELTEMLKDQADNVHFRENVTEEDGVQFNYVLQKGPATSRNAILLLQNMNFPETVVEDANEKASHFDQTQEWLSFES
ncbi:MAG TPA: AAA family ATPase [Atopostipes sp.]|nr:AAA family ATPase [Atopostipes sp.]